MYLNCKNFNSGKNEILENVKVKNNVLKCY